MAASIRPGLNDSRQVGLSSAETGSVGRIDGLTRLWRKHRWSCWGRPNDARPSQDRSNETLPNRATTFIRARCRRRRCSVAAAVRRARPAARRPQRPTSRPKPTSTSTQGCDPRRQEPATDSPCAQPSTLSRSTSTAAAFSGHSIFSISGFWSSAVDMQSCTLLQSTMNVFVFDGSTWQSWDVATYSGVVIWELLHSHAPAHGPGFGRIRRHGRSRSRRGSKRRASP